MNRREIVALLSASAGATLTGCDSSRKTDGTSGAGRRIRFATDWRAQAEHGGFYQAMASGEFAKRGLNVEIVQGGPGVNVPQLVASGAVELGMGSNSFIALNLVREAAPVKVVAAFFQKDPQVLIAHPSPALRSLADLKGRPVLLADASVDAFWVWLKAKYGFTDAQVRKYTFNSAPFLADRRAVQQGYLTSEPYTIRQQAGFEPKVFLLADEGYPGYAAMVMAAEPFLASDSPFVRAFVEAAAVGWRDYLNGDSRAADALIRKDNPEMSQDLLDYAKAQLKARAVVGDRPGLMTDQRWAEFFAIASAQGVYPPTLDYRRAYTLEFVG